MHSRGMSIASFGAVPVQLADAQEAYEKMGYVPWETSDGAVHGSREEAQAHQHWVDSEKGNGWPVQLSDRQDAVERMGLVPWETSDGAVHGSRAEAVKHEAEIEAAKQAVTTEALP